MLTWKKIKKIKEIGGQLVFFQSPHENAKTACRSLSVIFLDHA